MNNILIIGGDMRFRYTAARMSEIYKDVKIVHTGFCAPEHETSEIPENIIGEKFGTIILPLPASVDGIHINAPYGGDSPITVKHALSFAEDGGLVLYGKDTAGLHNECDRRGLVGIDYMDREDFSQRNALLTAEGTLEILIHESAVSLHGMKVLITGFGRIAKILCGQLFHLGAEVTIYARKASDRARAEIAGAKTVGVLGDLHAGAYDALVNTVPAPLLTRDVLMSLPRECLIIDLASKTGVADKTVPRKIIWALSLPGRVSPITAGNVIAATVSEIITEVRHEQV